MEQNLSWLCPTPDDRERFLDMQERLRLPRALTIVTGGLVAVALAFSTKAGWTVLSAMTLMVAVVVLGGWRLERRRRPELWIFFSTVLNIQLMLAVGAVITGGPKTFLVCMLAVPVVMVGARFSTRGLVVGAPISAVLILAATVGVDPAYVLAHPESVAVPLALVLCISVYVGPLVTSDVRHRAESTLDQLTGLLNRRGLEARFAEIAEQAALTEQPVSMVLADIDRFKSVNDEHGHPVGDRCSATLPTRCAAPCAPSSCCTESAARSSSCCSPAPTPPTRPRSPRSCASQSRSSVPRVSRWPAPSGSRRRTTRPSERSSARPTPPSTRQSASAATAWSHTWAQSPSRPDAQRPPW